MTAHSSHVALGRPIQTLSSDRRRARADEAVPVRDLRGCTLQPGSIAVASGPFPPPGCRGCACTEADGGPPALSRGGRARTAQTIVKSRRQSVENLSRTWETGMPGPRKPDWKGSIPQRNAIPACRFGKGTPVPCTRGGIFRRRTAGPWTGRSKGNTGLGSKRSQRHRTGCVRYDGTSWEQGSRTSQVPQVTSWPRTREIVRTGTAPHHFAPGPKSVARGPCVHRFRRPCPV